MNKKTGFTLIELLAVIVILAIIALITTPVITGVIEDATKGAAKDSMYSYVKSVELTVATNLKPGTALMSGTYVVKDGNLYSGATKISDIDLKGTKPESQIGYIILEKGQVKNANLKFDEYCVQYDGNEAISKEDCLSTPKTYVVGDEIYYNPETNKKCLSGDVNKVTNAKTGCLKWNIISLEDTPIKASIDIMLDHNTSGSVSWNAGVDRLTTDTASWNTSSKTTSRLISAQEITDIKKYSSSTSISSSWLTQNLGLVDTLQTPLGYWTSTSNSYAYAMTYSGMVSTLPGYTYYGVRPVITVSKSSI